MRPVAAVDDVRIRAATAADAHFVFEMLVEAVNWTHVSRLTAHEVAATPALAHYATGWMRRSDLGLVAETDSELVGAAWLRYFTADDPGYGFVADDIPELSIGVVAHWRGRGIGRQLLRALVREAFERGTPAVSLSVERANPARGLYVSEGFVVVGTVDDSDTMLARPDQTMG